MNIKRINWNILISIIITAGFVACSVFLFQDSFMRLFTNTKNFGLSIGFFFFNLFGIPHSIVFDIDNIEGLRLLDWIDFNSLKIQIENYFVAFALKSNFFAYLVSVLKLIFSIFKVVVVVAPFSIFIIVGIKHHLNKGNNDYNVDTKPLRVFKFVFAWYPKLKVFIISYIKYLSSSKYTKLWLWTWLLIWLFNFNAFTIFFGVFAYYFTVLGNFSFGNLGAQLFKLLYDLQSFVFFVPLPVWVVLGVSISNYFRRQRAYSRLYGFEAHNREYINWLPIVVMICGTMGKKKTTMLTDMALSEEVILRDKAFELILSNDLKFPYFPWINFENDLKSQMEEHKVYNLATCMRYVERMRRKFIIVTRLKNARKNYLSACDLDNKLFRNACYDYDYKRYGLTYNDGLRTVDLWAVLSSYARAYFIYIVESSLLVSNYSIREDSVLCSLGNFPKWNSDFFRRDSRLLESFSRHSHILDFDVLRLGRKLVENNALSGSFEFGVVVITEVGKERGNKNELAEVKKKDEEANRKNDNFNTWLKMCRHSATVDNYPFIKVLTDEQRPESWGADARDLCYINTILDGGRKEFTYPFFHLEQCIYSFLYNKFSSLYVDYRYKRGDNSLFMYLFKGIVAKLNHYYTRIENTFGFSKVVSELELGTQDKAVERKTYYLMDKKIYSDRFSTDCFSDFFAQEAVRCKFGINDYDVYSTTKAGFSELKKQNSYFMEGMFNHK